MNLKLYLLSIAVFLLSFPDYLVAAVPQEKYSFYVSCTSNGQVCTPSGHVGLTLAEEATVSAYFIGGGPCSSINVNITGPISGSTGWTSSVEVKTYYLGKKKLSQGTYDFYATATGTIGGCNTGTLFSWRGEMLFIIDEDLIAIKNLGPSLCPSEKCCY